MKGKIIIFILSLVYSCYLLAIWAADHYKSSKLNPLNSEYYYDKNQFAKAIEVEPSRAVYHMLYAIDLMKQNPNANVMMRKFILSQIKQAVELKPFSKKYKEIYDTYAPFLTPAD